MLQINKGSPIAKQKGKVEEQGDKTGRTPKQAKRETVSMWGVRKFKSVSEMLQETTKNRSDLSAIIVKYSILSVIAKKTAQLLHSMYDHTELCCALFCDQM